MKTIIRSFGAALLLFFAAATLPAQTNLTVNQGDPVTIWVTYTGVATSIQWAKSTNGGAPVLIAGATTDTLKIASVSPADAGQYTVVLSNSNFPGTPPAVSPPGVLVVVSPPVVTGLNMAKK